LFNRFPNKSSCIAYLVDKGRDESDSPTRWSYVLSTHIRHIEIIGLAMYHLVAVRCEGACSDGVPPIWTNWRFRQCLLWDSSFLVLVEYFSDVLSLPRDILVVAPELTGFSTPADSNRRFPIIFGCEIKLQSLWYHILFKRMDEQVKMSKGWRILTYLRMTYRARK
jgi:hypothetical protein